MEKNMKYLDVELASTNTTRALEKLSSDCSNHQFIREFTKNAIEAIQHYIYESGDEEYKGEVTIQVNKFLKENTEIGASKISFIDNGIGMSREESMRYIRSLADSSDYKKESGYKNFGFGAKISAITRNKVGIHYDSWKNDEGYNVTLYYDRTRDAYTLRKNERDSEEFYYLPLDNHLKNKTSIKKHGTIVTLWGNEQDTDTYSAKTHNLNWAQNTWVALYLNRRFYIFPKNIKVRAEVDQYREDSEGKTKAYLCEIKGLKEVIESHSMDSGSLEVTDAIIKWYILKPNRQGHSREYVNGHTAVIFEDEVFNITSGVGNKAIKFGISFGYKDVVLHIFPKGKKFEMDSTRENVETIFDNGERGLPWSVWQVEFYERMPDKLKEYIDKISSEFITSNSDAMRNRLKEMEKFFSLGKFRPKASGKTDISKNEILDKTGYMRMGERKPLTKETFEPSAGDASGLMADYLAVVQKNSNISGEQVNNKNPFPEVKWVKNDGNLVDMEEIDERAALFREVDYTILGNSDFQGFIDLSNFFEEKYPNISKDIVKKEVRTTFEQQLIETIAGAQALKNRRKWSPPDYEKATSPEALTAACMVRYYQFQDINRKLTQIEKDTFKQTHKEMKEEISEDS